LGAGFYDASGYNTITRVLKEKKWNEVPAALELYRNQVQKLKQDYFVVVREKDYFGGKVSKK
jgi:hypothetical protein